MGSPHNPQVSMYYSVSGRFLRDIVTSSPLILTLESAIGSMLPSHESFPSKSESGLGSIPNLGTFSIQFEYLNVKSGMASGFNSRVHACHVRIAEFKNPDAYKAAVKQWIVKAGPPATVSKNSDLQLLEEVLAPMDLKLEGPKSWFDRQLFGYLVVPIPTASSQTAVPQS